MSTDYITNDTDLKSVADAIRAKTGKTDPLTFPDEFASEIAGIETGGGSGLPPRDTSVDWDTFEGLYFVFDNDALPAGHPMRRMPCGFGTGTYAEGCKLEFGTMVGTVFTPREETETMVNTYGDCNIFNANVPDYGEKYTIARVTPRGNNHITTLWEYMLDKPGTMATSSATMFTVCIYGRAPSMTAIRSDGDKLKNCIIFDFETAQRSEMYNSATYRGMQSLREITNANYGVATSMKSMSGMFQDCASLQTLDLSTFDTSVVTNMSDMFNGCASLQTLDLSTFDTSVVTNMSYMFNGCASLQTLDLSTFDTSSVTNMSHMFRDCVSLQTLDLSAFDTSSVTNMSNMFNGCASLQTLDLSAFDTSSVTNMSHMFRDCVSLQTLDLSAFDTSSVTNMPYMFRDCASLQNFTSCVFGLDVDFSESNKLTHDSLMSIINNLATVTSTKKLTLGNTNKAKLSDAEIAIATGKGWTVA